MQNLLQYIRGNGRRKIGVVVAVPTEEGYSIGWSVCNDIDVFDKHLCKHIALERAYVGTNVKPPKRMVWREVEDSYVKFDAVNYTLRAMQRRAERYFKLKESTLAEANQQT